MSTTQDPRTVRLAQNQSLFRAVNERIETLNDAFSEFVPYGDWVCECDDASCTERMSLTLAEYEAIRQDGARFPVLPGHENLEIERVVEVHERYVVVEKVGVGRAISIEHDPRR